MLIAEQAGNCMSFVCLALIHSQAYRDIKICDIEVISEGIFVYVHVNMSEEI